MCPEPGPHDLFLLVLIDGQRATIQHAADHARWRVAAERLAESQRCQVKVLPMTGGELMNYLGIRPAAPHPLESVDTEFRAQAVRNCMDVLRECGSQEDRELALDLLGKMGALN
ncbi:hypothetical protein M8312_04750 [Sphingomonas sp. KRR8]|uniref:hypothetical protein n=1 Tax=Sphingomonas sp. KRR8 TaxID=2942996 RepID=UPI00202238CE|nr:hypothetical protein [Sphingomonas sp. KRR8]URD61824.1 hypothetical protein M8312_04750 [Sphingomonas sp. KRR8]